MSTKDKAQHRVGWFGVGWLEKITSIESLNFLVTNRIPRISLSRFIGWYSTIKSPLLTKVSLSIWKLFNPDLNFSECKTDKFTSLQECFIRELKPDARPIDTDPQHWVCPSDGIVVAKGTIRDGTLMQVKGLNYPLKELLPSGVSSLNAADYEGAQYLTVRLRSSMYHRFHAPTDCELRSVNYISGDQWNVNPITLKRIEKLYCKNERIVLSFSTANNHPFLMIPVAAVLVGRMKLSGFKQIFDSYYRGPTQLACRQRFHKGGELGYFLQGSTIVMILPQALQFHASIQLGETLSMGQTLVSLCDESLTQSIVNS